MFMEELHSKRNEIEAIASNYGASRIRVFGSVVRGEENSESDVDLLVDLPHGYDLFSQRIPLCNELSKLIGKKVDMIVEHELNCHIRQYIIDEARYL